MPPTRFAAARSRNERRIIHYSISKIREARAFVLSTDRTRRFCTFFSVVGADATPRLPVHHTRLVQRCLFLFPDLSRRVNQPMLTVLSRGHRNRSRSREASDKGWTSPPPPPPFRPRALYSLSALSGGWR